LNSNL